MILIRGLFRLSLCALAAFLVVQFLPWWLLGSLALVGVMALVPVLGRL